MLNAAASITALSFRLASDEIIQKVDSRTVTLVPAHSNDPNDPNKSFSKYTARAEFKFVVSNADVFDVLAPGVVYNLVMVREDSGAVIQVLPPLAPDPAPVDNALVDPAPVDPAPVDPALVDPAPVDPALVDPAPVDPAPVDPAPVDPAPAAASSTAQA